MSVEAYDDPTFADVVNSADLVCADGMPLVKAIDIKYGRKIERVAGMDIMPALIEAAAESGLSVYFYGSTDEILRQIVKKAKSDHPRIRIAGYYSPPFRPMKEDEISNVRKRINESKAQIVLVALGCPKQEKWMAENSQYLNAVLLGVGGAFPVYVKYHKRAPKWMREMSLEWFYRLMQDPKRLYKRYLYANSKFLFLFAKELIFRRNT